MKWVDQYEEHRKFFEQIRDLGEKTPLDFEPELDIVSNYVLSVFGDLSRTRAQDGMGGIHPITYNEMISYFTIHECSYQLDVMCRMIVRIDHMFIELKGKK